MTIYIYSVSNTYHTTCICLFHIPKFSHRINSPILQNTETYKHKNKQHLPAPQNSHRLSPTQQNIYRWSHRQLLKTHTEKPQKHTSSRNKWCPQYTDYHLIFLKYTEQTVHPNYYTPLLFLTLPSCI